MIHTKKRFIFSDKLFLIVWDVLQINYRLRFNQGESLVKNSAVFNRFCRFHIKKILFLFSLEKFLIVLAYFWYKMNFLSILDGLQLTYSIFDCLKHDGFHRNYSGNFLHQTEKFVRWLFQYLHWTQTNQCSTRCSSENEKFPFSRLCWEISTRFAHILTIFSSRMQWLCSLVERRELYTKRTSKNKKQKSVDIFECVYFLVSTKLWRKQH